MVFRKNLQIQTTLTLEGCLLVLESSIERYNFNFKKPRALPKTSKSFIGEINDKSFKIIKTFDKRRPALFFPFIKGGIKGDNNVVIDIEMGLIPGLKAFFAFSFLILAILFTLIPKFLLGGDVLWFNFIYPLSFFTLFIAAGVPYFNLVAKEVEEELKEIFIKGHRGPSLIGSPIKKKRKIRFLPRFTIGWWIWILGLALLMTGPMMFGGFLGFSNTVLEDDSYRESISIEKEKLAESVIINIERERENLKIVKGKGELISGTYRSKTGELRVRSELWGDKRQWITIDNSKNVGWWNFNKNFMDLEIDSKVPTKINVDVGFVKMNLDLTDMFVEDVVVDAEFSSLNFILGDRLKAVNLDVKLVMSLVKITIPDTVGVHLYVSSFIIKPKNLIGFKEITPNVVRGYFFPGLNTKIYESENYQGSFKKVNISLGLTVSKLEINWRK